jgi:hypothetical protein
VRIKRNVDIDYFKNSEIFDYNKEYKLAIYYHGLRQNDFKAPLDLPSDYSQKNWEHSKHTFEYKYQTLGVVICNVCNLRRKHNLTWPNEAFFQISYKLQTLWAYDRESALILLDYIESDERKKNFLSDRGSNVFMFLFGVPEVFQSRKARPIISKSMRKMLNLPPINL